MMITLKSLFLLFLLVEFAMPLECYDGMIIPALANPSVAVRTCDPGDKCAKIHLKIDMNYLKTSVFQFNCISTPCKQKRNCKQLMRVLQGYPGVEKGAVRLRDCKIHCCKEDLCNEGQILTTTTPPTTTTTTLPLPISIKPDFYNVTNVEIPKEENYSIYYILSAGILILVILILFIANIGVIKRYRRQ